MRNSFIIMGIVLVFTNIFVINQSYADVAATKSIVPNNVKPISVTMRTLIYNHTYLAEIVSPVDINEGVLKKLMKRFGIIESRSIVSIQLAPRSHEYLRKIGCPWISGNQLAQVLVRPGKRYVDGILSKQSEHYPLYYVDSVKLLDEKRCYETVRRN